MKNTQSQSDQADRRHTGLKSGVLNKNKANLGDISTGTFFKIQPDIYNIIDRRSDI